MDLLLETIKTLKNKGWYRELQTELNEVIHNMNPEEQEHLLNILNSDKVTKEQIIELLRSSIVTSNKYKYSKLVQ